MKKILLILTIIFSLAFAQRPVYSDFVPGTTSIYDLGSAANTWDWIYVDNISASYIVISADGDTIKLDPGTALYAIEYEHDNLRLWGLDTLGNVVQTGISPNYSFIDSSGADNDISAYFSVDLTDAGSGTEDADWQLNQQVAGSDVRTLFSDADAGWWIYSQGTTTDYIAITNTEMRLSGATPSVDIYDSDGDDGDISASIDGGLTVVTTGAENMDMTYSAQVAGAMTPYITFDADANLELASVLDIVLDPVGNNVNPGSDNADALGASGTAWSDLFIGSGGVIDWNATDKLTHSANTMTISGFTTWDMGSAVAIDFNSAPTFTSANGLFLFTSTAGLQANIMGAGTAPVAGNHITLPTAGVISWVNTHELTKSTDAMVVSGFTSWDFGAVTTLDFDADYSLTGGDATITQPVSTTGSPTGLKFTGGAHTTLTASTEATDVLFDLSRTVQFATGALATQRAFRIEAPTYGFVAASTLTDAYTAYIDGIPAAGANATITNAWALGVGGAVQIDGDLTFVGTQTITTSTGQLNILTGGGAGDIVLTPEGAGDIILDAHWNFNANALTSLVDTNTTLTAYAGRAVVIEDVTFDGGAVGAVTTLSMNNQLTNSLAIGTSPFAITSTTVNTNLNADLLDGEHATAFQDVDATLTALAGLTIADVSIIEGTGADAVAMVASGGNNYMLGSNAGNTALEFKASTGTGSAVLATSPTFVTQITTPSVTNSATLAISSTAAGVNITTHSDATDDFTVNTTMLVVEGDNGFVGIGTAAPGFSLDVVGASAIGLVRYSADAFGVGTLLRKSRNAAEGGFTILQDNDLIGLVRFMADDGTDLGTESGRFHVEVDDGAPTTSSIGGAAIISTAKGDGVDDLTEAARWDRNQLMILAGNMKGPGGFVIGTATTATMLTFGANGEITVADSLTVVSDLTAASYGGITEANLVDKTAIETISGAWIFSDATTALTIGAAGAGVDYRILFNGEGAASGTITYMEDEDRFDFDNDVDFIGDLTANTIASDGTVSGTTITASTGFALGDTDYIGITGNEIITFNAAGTIIFSGGTFGDGTAALDGSGAWSGATYNGLSITAAANTFLLAQGTASLDVAATIDVDIDQNLTVNTEAVTLNQSLSTTDDVTFDDLAITNKFTQETYVIRKVISVAGMTDATATNVFTITTVTTEFGGYKCNMSVIAGDDMTTGNANTAVMGLEAQFVHVVENSGNTSTSSAVLEISQTASANEGTGAVTDITMTAVATSETVRTIQADVDVSAGGVADIVIMVELTYWDLATAPVIAGI